jgi:UDP-glucose 4-epimerase
VKRVLVTGGCGYIGSHMVHTLLHAGYQITVLDDLSNGHEDVLPSAVRFVRSSLHDARALQEALHGVDAVFHFAGSIQVAESVRDPAKYYRNNVDASLQLFDSMQRVGVRRLIFSSTAAVYGSGDGPKESLASGTSLDEHATIDPASPYGETKWAIERALRHFPFESVSLRYFNAAGAAFGLHERHEPETHLIPLALGAARGQRPPLPVYGTDYATPDGTCVRDYVHVKDLCQAHLAANERLGRLPRRAYNLGGGVGSSVREVLDAVASVVGKPVPHTLEPRRPGDPPSLVANIAKAQEDLGFAPIHSSLREIVTDASQ